MQILYMQYQYLNINLQNNGVIKHKLLSQSDISLFDTITKRRYPITGTGTYYTS